MDIRPLALPGIEALSGLPALTNQELYNNLPTREEAEKSLRTVLSYAGAKVLTTVRTAAAFLGENKPKFKDTPAFPPLSERKAFVTEGFTSSYATEDQLDSLLQERDDVADKLWGALAIIESYKSAYDSISGALEGITESAEKDYPVFYNKGEEMERLYHLKEELSGQLQALNLTQYRQGQSYAEFFQQVVDDLKSAKLCIESYEKKISEQKLCFTKMNELLNKKNDELKKLTDENKQIIEEGTVHLAERNSMLDAAKKQKADLAQALLKIENLESDLSKKYEIQNQLERYKNTNQTLNKEKANAETTIQHLRDQVKAEELKVKQLEIESVEKKKKLESLEQDLKVYVSLGEMQKFDIKTTSSMKLKVEDELSELKKSLETSQAELKKSKAHNSALQSELREKLDLLTQYEKEKVGLNRQIADLDATKSQLKSTKQELESTRQQMNLLEKNLAGSTKKISELEAMRSKYNIMCNQMTAAEVNEKNLKSDLFKKDEEIQNFQTRLEQQKKKNDELSSCLESVKSRLKKADSEFNEFHSERLELFDKIEYLEQKINESGQTEKNTEDLKKKLSAAKTEITEKNQKIQELEEQINGLELEKDKLKVTLMEPRDNHTAPDVSHFYSLEPGGTAYLGENNYSSVAFMGNELSSMAPESTKPSLPDTGMINRNVDSGPHSILSNVEEPESNKTSNFENKLLLKRVREAEEKLQQSENQLESIKEEFAQFKNDNRGRLSELNSEKQFMQTKLKDYESEQDTLQIDLEKANQEIRELKQKLTDQHSKMQTELSKAEVAYEAENKELLDLKLKFKHDEQIRTDLQETQSQLVTETGARENFVADLYKQLGEEHKTVIEALVKQHFGV